MAPIVLQVVGSNKIDIEDLLAVLGQYGEKCSRKSDSAKTGMYFEAFHHNGGNLARRGSPLWRSWNGMKAFVTHPAHAKDVWFSNDNDFKKVNSPRLPCALQHHGCSYIFLSSLRCRRSRNSTKTTSTSCDGAASLTLRFQAPGV
jgi:hypothetical protein